MTESEQDNQESLSSEGGAEEQPQQPGRKKTGPKPFNPSEEQRSLVLKLTGFGVKQEDICKVITHEDGSPISDRTLRKHFRDELDTGLIDANAKVANALFKSAMQGSVGAQIFWLKSRARWKETYVMETADKDGNPMPLAGGTVQFYLPHNGRDEIPGLKLPQQPQQSPAGESE